MKNNLKISTSIVLLASMLLFGIISFSNAEVNAAEYQWRLAHEEVEGSFYDLYANELKRLLAEKSDGRIAVDIYPAMSLGSSQDMVELVQDGVLEFNLASDGHIGSLVPEAQIFLLDYIFPQDIQVVLEAVNNGEAIELVNDGYRDRDLEPLSHVTAGWQLWTANKPLTSPEDFEGFRMRTMSSRLLIEAFEAYGANPTTLDFSEVYSGLQLGVIDGQLNAAAVVEEMGFYEVQDYLMKSYSNPFMTSLVTNIEFYENLPDDIKKILDESVEELVSISYELQKDLGEERLEIMLEEKPELEVIELTDEEIEEFKELSMSVRETFKDIGGENAEEILNLMIEDIEAASN